MFALINRNGVCVDIQKEKPRFVKLQTEPCMVVGCSEKEATGVMASDCDTIYQITGRDYSSNPNSVNVVEIDSIPSSYMPNEFIYNAEQHALIRRYTLDEKKLLKQEENKLNFSNYLHSLTIPWKDGKEYGVSEADQNEISLNLTQYQLAVNAGVENPVLEWHAKQEECVTWSAEDLTELSLAIAQVVYPFYHQMQQYKTAIFNAESIEEVEAIDCVYGDINDETTENME